MGDAAVAAAASIGYISVGQSYHFLLGKRRNQKLLEQAQSPALTPEVRIAMGDTAVAAAASICCISVGAVEFLLDENGSFYFMEMNTRIKEDIVLKGYSIECRTNAQDAFKGFCPGPGKITSYLPAGGPFLRMDSLVYPGYVVSPSYDTLLGKVHSLDSTGSFVNMTTDMNRLFNTILQFVFFLLFYFAELLLTSLLWAVSKKNRSGKLERKIVRKGVNKITPNETSCAFCIERFGTQVVLSPVKFWRHVIKIHDGKTLCETCKQLVDQKREHQHVCKEVQNS